MITRSKRRLQDQQDNVTHIKQVTPHPKKNKTTAAKQRHGRSTRRKSRVNFLDLPAEIRNRIYDFAVEKAHKSPATNLPLLTRRPTTRGPWPIKRSTDSAHNFYALTQVCHQVRAEYRPLWIGSTSFRIPCHQFSSFVRTFYENANDQETPGPKSLQISYSHGEQHGAIAKLLPFLTFRTHHPGTQIEFVAHEVADHVIPEWLMDVCSECGYRGRGRVKPPCAHQRSELQHWRLDMEKEYEYLDAANDILAHDVELWKSDIRLGRLRSVDIIDPADIDDEERVSSSLVVPGTGWRWVRGLVLWDVYIGFE